MIIMDHKEALFQNTVLSLYLATFILKTSYSKDFKRIFSYIDFFFMSGYFLKTLIETEIWAELWEVGGYDHISCEFLQELVKK